MLNMKIFGENVCMRDPSLSARFSTGIAIRPQGLLGVLRIIFKRQPPFRLAFPKHGSKRAGKRGKGDLLMG